MSGARAQSGVIIALGSDLGVRLASCRGIRGAPWRRKWNSENRLTDFGASALLLSIALGLGGLAALLALTPSSVAEHA